MTSIIVAVDKGIDNTMIYSDNSGIYHLLIQLKENLLLQVV